MRFFDRNQIALPKIFESSAFERERARVRDLIFASDDKMRAQSRVPYRPELINSPEIKSAIEAVFGRICAYCETPFEIKADLTLEQHRPRSNAGDPDTLDGHLFYAWLSYEWDNILPVCTNCSRHKRDRFPVGKDTRGKLGASIEELRAQEIALLIDPCFDDVAEHLMFYPGGPVMARSVRGERTIEVLGLNDRRIHTERARRFRAMASDLVERPAMYEIVRAGEFRSWASHVIAFRNGVIGSAGAFSLALLKVCEERLWESDRFRPFIRPSSEYTSEASLLERILEALSEMPRDAREELLTPFLQERDGSATEEAVEDDPKAPPGMPREAPRSRNVSLADLPAARFPISHVEIANFKALRNVTFDLPEQVANPELTPCMLILGENATGKSSVLEAVSLAVLGTSEISELNAILDNEEVSPEEFVHRPDTEDWDRRATDPLAVKLSFFGSETHALLNADADAQAFSGSTRPSKIVLAYGPRRFFTKRKTRRFRAPAYRIRSLFDPMEVIANPIDWLLELDDESRFDAAVRALRVVLMLEPKAKILREDGRILIDTPQGQTPLSKLSVGYKSVVALAVDIIREMFYHYRNLEEACAVVIIDEIETHLHPRWKMRIVGLLREAFPKIQFVMTTHDPLCLRGMYQGEVFVLQRNSEDSRVETLEELPDVQGMRADQILTSEFFGLGSTDPEMDAKVDRYHQLTRKQSLSDAESEERRRLAAEVDKSLMVGDTLAEQTDAAAIARADIDTVPLAESKGTERTRLIREKLSRLLAE